MLFIYFWVSYNIVKLQTSLHSSAIANFRYITCILKLKPRSQLFTGTGLLRFLIHLLINKVTLRHLMFVLPCYAILTLQTSRYLNFVECKSFILFLHQGRQWLVCCYSNGIPIVFVMQLKPEFYIMTSHTWFNLLTQMYVKVIRYELCFSFSYSQNMPINVINLQVWWSVPNVWSL